MWCLKFQLGIILLLMAAKQCKSWTTISKHSGDGSLIYVDFNNYDLEVRAGGSNGGEFDIHFKYGSSGWIAFEWHLSSTSSELSLNAHSSGTGSGCDTDGTLTNIPVPNTSTRTWKFSKDSSYLYIYCDGYKVASLYRYTYFGCLSSSQWNGLGTTYRIFFYSDDEVSQSYRLSSKSCSARSGGWSSWNSWGSCSCNHVSGTGTWTRTRSCNNPSPYCGGSSCSGSSSDTGNCDSQCCRTANGGWSSWSSWGTCSCNHTTGTGTWTRTRSCNNPSPYCGGSSCSGSSSETGNCDSQCCQTVNGGWTDWGNWSTCDCDHSTGTGTWNRTRSCTNPSPSCYGRNCVGEILNNGTCDDQCCQTVNGGWTDWGNWSTCDCDHSTGTGTWNRTRSCTNPSPSCFGMECVGEILNNGTCDDQCCLTVNGGWTDWGNWSTCDCDHSTGTGTWNRTRSCTNPSPSCFGASCVGEILNNGTCDDQCCQTVNGGWTDWGNWTTCDCDHSTGTGTWNRTRSCTNPAPSCYGTTCMGETQDNGTCDDQCCQTVNGGWTDWGNWSTCDCDHSSGTGTWNRTRSCTNPSPSCYGMECAGEILDHGTCDDQCCMTVDGVWLDWTDWGNCNCEASNNTETLVGYRLRSRVCSKPICFGSPCIGDNFDRLNCSERCMMCSEGMKYNAITDNCTICERGTFSTMSSHICSPCPNGKDSLEGSSSLSECFHESACYEDNRLGLGPIQDVLSNISDIKACISSCRSLKGCLRASYSQNGTCWLHRSVIGIAQSEQRNGIVTASLKCLDGCEKGYRFDMVTERCSVCPLNTACNGLTLIGDPCPAGSFSVPYLLKNCVPLAWLSVPSGILGLAVIIAIVMRVRRKKSKSQGIQECSNSIEHASQMFEYFEAGPTVEEQCKTLSLTQDIGVTESTQVSGNANLYTSMTAESDL